MDLAVLVVVGWYDGPLEGILTDRADGTCWYFDLFAERRETETLDDRLFGLWPVSSGDSSVLIGDFADEPVVWPPAGGLGSPAARDVVQRLVTVERGLPALMVRSPDLVEIQGTWDVLGRTR